MQNHKPIPLQPLRRVTRQLGPGLITGAADDDPSGLATYSQAGAAFGAGMLWTLVLTTPLMIAIQMVSARIGWVTGRGLAANICRVMPRWLAFALVAMLVLANTLNIAADVAAMGDALELVITGGEGGGQHVYALLFGFLCAVLPVVFSYDGMVRLLKWLTLALLAYVAVVFALHAQWGTALRGHWLPDLHGGSNYWMMIVAVLGTTISPYLFFWQAAQESEQRSKSLAQGEPVTHAGFMREHLSRIKLDTMFGMVFSNLIALCVILATALTLNQSGILDIQTTAQAALALRPIAGDFAFTLFALGIIGTGMLAVPVLAGSAAYAVADFFEWRSGLDHKLGEAKGFYGVLIFATAIGTLLNFTSVDAIKALVWSAVVNGVIAVPIMGVLMLIGSETDILGVHTLTVRHRVTGWLAFGVMLMAVVAMLWTFVTG